MPSGVLPLTLMRSGVEPSAARQRRANRLGDAADLRAMTDHDEVEVAEAPTRRGDAAECVAQKREAVGVLPGGIGVREQAADVPSPAAPSTASVTA